MYRIVWQSAAVLVTENDKGMALARKGAPVESTAFLPEATGWPEQFYANMDVLHAVWTDFEAEGGPKLNLVEFSKAMDVWVGDVVDEHNAEQARWVAGER